MRTREYAATKAMAEQAFPVAFSAFADLEKAVPPPQLINTKHGMRYRFVEELACQAIVAKLARQYSGLQSTWVLLNTGMTQEAAVLQRILDEIGHDVMFLSGPLTVGERTKRHDEFLKEFFQEEFDDDLGPIDSPQKRNRISRQNIRAYNARTYSTDGNYDTALKVNTTIDRVYSGFVHVAGAQVMDMYGGDPPKFQIIGMNGTSRMDEALRDFRNYLHRGILNLALAAQALGLPDLYDDLMKTSANMASKFDLHD